MDRHKQPQTVPAGSGIRVLLSVAALGLVLVGVVAIAIYYYLTGQEPVAPARELRIPASDSPQGSDRKSTPAFELGPLDIEGENLDPSASVDANGQHQDPNLLLPELNFSDSSVRSEMDTLVPQHTLSEWLTTPQLIRRFVLLVDNVSRGTIPRKQLRDWAPQGKFEATEKAEGRYVAAAAGFSRYNRYADTLAGLDAGAAVDAYRMFKPLFDEAYRELGYPAGDFNRPLLAAIAHLLATPKVPADALLTRPSVVYKYVDSGYESLTAAQKQFLRMGPRNTALIRGKLAEFSAALQGSGGH